jgi:hypothetical protein
MDARRKKARTQISDAAIAEVVNIMSIFSNCGTSNRYMLQLHEQDDTQTTSPFVDDRWNTCMYWSPRDSTACVELHAGSFGTKDSSRVQEMIDAYTHHQGEHTMAPFQYELNGLKLVWQLSLNPNAMRILNISPELVEIARKTFFKQLVIQID